MKAKKFSAEAAACPVCVGEGELVYLESFGDTDDSLEEEEQDEEESILQTRKKMWALCGTSRIPAPVQSRSILWPVRNKAFCHIRCGAKPVA